MQESPLCRLSPLLEERLQLLGHGGRDSTLNGVRPQKECTLTLCERGLDRDVKMGTSGVRDAQALRVKVPCVAVARCKEPVATGTRHRYAVTGPRARQSRCSWVGLISVGVMW